MEWLLRSFTEICAHRHVAVRRLHKRRRPRSSRPADVAERRRTERLGARHFRRGVASLADSAGSFDLLLAVAGPGAAVAGNSDRGRGRASAPPAPAAEAGGKAKTPAQAGRRAARLRRAERGDPGKANREFADEKSTAPAPKREPSQNAGAPQQSEQPPAAQEKKAESPPPPETKPVPEAEQPAAPYPAPAEADAAPPAQTVEPKPAPPPAPAAKAPPGVPLPTADELPQYQFAHAATELPIVGGNADTRYFTIVYGMIRAHFRQPHMAKPPRPGTIVFTVDELGNLVQRRVTIPSGSPNLDIAVMAAIAEASPYPAPPDWQPRSMRLIYGR